MQKITRPDYIVSGQRQRDHRGSPAHRRTPLAGWATRSPRENSDKVKELGVAKEPNGTCVVPSHETIADGSYPVARTLYIYVNTAEASRPAIPGSSKRMSIPYLADGILIGSITRQTVPAVEPSGGRPRGDPGAPGGRVVRWPSSLGSRPAGPARSPAGPSTSTRLPSSRQSESRSATEAPDEHAGSCAAVLRGGAGAQRRGFGVANLP